MIRTVHLDLYLRRAEGKKKVLCVNKNHNFCLHSMQDFKTKFEGKPDRNKWGEMQLGFIKGTYTHAMFTWYLPVEK